MSESSGKHPAKALLFAVFVQLYSFKAYVNINLYVALDCLSSFFIPVEMCSSGLRRSDHQAALDSEPVKVMDLFVYSKCNFFF